MVHSGLVIIVVICVLVALAIKGVLRPKTYPYLLFGISGFLILYTTLAGPYLVGSDIHLEYYYAQLRAGRDVILPIVDLPQGTSVLSYLTDSLIAFKVIYPLMFAGIPVILYFIFKKWVTEKQALLASFLFIAFPAFSMEIPGIPRQMVAEVFLVLLLYLLIVSGIKLKYKIPLAVGCGILLPLIHYSIGMLALVLLGVGCIIGYQKKLTGLILLTVIVTSAIYFPIAEGGAVAIKLGHIYNFWAPEVLEIPVPDLPKPFYLEPIWAEHPPEAIPPTGLSFFSRYEALILSGLGFDFSSTSLSGKIFRVLQWIFIGLAIAGIWKLRKNKNYRVFMLGGVSLLVLMLIPGVSNMLNITRFLHVALILLAPVVVVVLKPKVMLPLLLTYFLFTSGFAFEVAKYPNIETITIPYSFGLSSHRLDLGASITKDDWEVRQYIHENELYPVASDIVGSDFIGELVGWRDDLHVAFVRRPFEVHGIHVFIRTWNVQEGTFTVWNGVGCRKYVDPMEYYGIDINENIVYQKGDARVIWVP